MALSSLLPMRIALVYDCLYPNTIGGAERWYRNLAEQLDGTHRVTYLTRRQWNTEEPEAPFETIGVAPGGKLYTASGRRRIGPPIRFGWGVFWHLLRHGGRYDAIHTASFPYFSVLAAAMALRLRRSSALLIVDWHELVGPRVLAFLSRVVGGRIGAAVQALCLRLPDQSFTFSRLVEERLVESNHGAAITRLTGEYAGASLEDVALLTFTSEVGRWWSSPVVISLEMHVAAIPPAIAAARHQIPDLECTILGDGPETETVRKKVRTLGLEEAIDVRGRVDSSEVAKTIASAICLLNPSEREGYGQVIVEAAALGTPAIVVAGPENAATELIEPGINGYVAESCDPEELGRLIVDVARHAERLQRSTREWYADHSNELSLQHSLDTVLSTYAQLAGR